MESSSSSMLRTTFTEPPLSSDDASLTKDASTKTTTRKGGKGLTNVLTVARWLILDVPYLFLLLIFGVSQLAIYYHDQYITPQLDLLHWNRDRAKHEVTYYKRLCTAADQSTFEPEDLILSNDMDADEMVDSMLTHGISVVPNLLTPETAATLRESILHYNTIEENFGVISNKHRYSYGIRMEQDEIVRTAVKEIATNENLQKLLPKLIGDDPALYKFHAITSAAGELNYASSGEILTHNSSGAADQHFHWDVKASASATAYSRTFAPIYSLFIPLQHTPASMGPTDICPGSHVCSAGTNFCEQTAFQILLQTENVTEPVWPATYGALMNQQTTHRGRAHYDDTAPDRVLFILAITPRPRSTEHVSLLETRSLSLGGSYAIHWTQWGHTWSDLYKDTMYNPLKTLKSLGLYKPSGTKWGREWLMTALLQLANGDYWGRRYLEKHIQNGGFWFFPKFLHAGLRTYDNEDDEDFVWYDFVRDTFLKAVCLAQYCLIGVFGTYTVAYTWVQLIVAVQKRQGFAPVVGNFKSYWIRMIVLHGMAIGFFYGICNYMDSLPWSKHIQSRKMYTLPRDFSAQPDLPATLPVPQDILMLDDFQSDYLASYTRLYDVGHPGNKKWKRLIGGDYYQNYSHMPLDVQNALQESLVTHVETSLTGRFLTKNSINQWARMTRPAAKEFVHKELLRINDNRMDVLLREIAFRRSESKFGTWRDTALHKVHIPDLLRRLEQRLGATPGAVVGAPTKQVGGSSTLSAAGFKRSAVHAPLILLDKVSLAPRASPSIVDHEEEEATDGPFHGAWLQVGDRVDALYSESETYWYPGTIVAAFAHSNKWTIQYDNYEGTREVCRYCVFPLKPLELNDLVEVSYNKKFYPGHLHGVYDRTVDFVFHDTPDKVFSDISLRKYRRPLPYIANPEEIEYDLGEPVFALWYNREGEHDGNYYAANIVALEEEPHVYTLMYTDSDEVSGMHSRDLLPMTY